MKTIFIYSRKQIKLLWFLTTYIYAFSDMFITYQIIVAHFKSLQIIYDRHLNINCGPQNNAKLYTEHWHKTFDTAFV